MDAATEKTIKMLGAWGWRVCHGDPDRAPEDFDFAYSQGLFHALSWRANALLEELDRRERALRELVLMAELFPPSLFDILDEFDATRTVPKEATTCSNLINGTRS
jgi:hypothetical protein